MFFRLWLASVVSLFWSLTLNLNCKKKRRKKALTCSHGVSLVLESFSKKKKTQLWWLPNVCTTEAESDCGLVCWHSSVHAVLRKTDIFTDILPLFIEYLVLSLNVCAVNDPYSRLWGYNILGDSDSVSSFSLELVSDRLILSESPESKWWVCCYENFVMKLQSCPHPLCLSHKCSVMEKVLVKS